MGKHVHVLVMVIQLFHSHSTLSQFVLQDVLLDNPITTNVDLPDFNNSLSASLLLNIFLSFEVGIAHAIANFK